MATRWSSTSLLLLLGLIALAALPLPLLEALPAVCLFRNLFGFECPGCGMTRAIACILHGEFARALHYNRAVVVVLPLLCGIALKNATYRRRLAGL